MKIKKLQIYGFKTFVQPTEILFHDGVTSVVGPNGCGKSNIIDALRWVMGEKSAKGLRGDSMEDVIFSGCASRKALNFAEVTLTLTEVEGKLPEKFGNYHEISVTRRLHRSGDSEYLINKVHCRLKDVIDLFLDTGLGKRAYSIVEQGRIDSILSAKPIDRRFLIEEAAGLSKYRARRDETLVKMKHTAENLDRLNDIITEVKREMTSLKRQAGRARAFKELRDEKRVLERNFLITAFNSLSEKLTSAQAMQESVRVELASARATSDTLSMELEKDRLDLFEEEKRIEDSKRKHYGLKSQIADRENRQKFLEHEATSLSTHATRALSEAEGLDEKARLTGAELEELRMEAETLAESLQEMSAHLEDAEKLHRTAVEERRYAEDRLEHHRKGSFALVSELSKANNALDHTTRQEKEARRKLENYDRQEFELDGKLERIEAEARAKQDHLEAAEDAFGKVNEERERLEEDAEDLTFERQTLTRRAEELRKKLHAGQSRLKGLEDIKSGLECYGAGVKSILRHARDNKWVGVRGVVADTVSVPQKYETALEAALGERLQYVVVADAEQAMDGVSVLREKEAGRSTFAPADLREAADVKMPKVSEEWAHGALLDLVRVEPGGERIARTLLGGFFVVDTLKHAFDLWRQNPSGATYVTLEGDTLTSEGVVTGGDQSKAGSGLLKRNREIAELHAETVELTAKLTEAEDELAEVSARHDETTRRLDYLREEAHRHELSVAHASRDMAQFAERKENLEEQRQVLEFERDETMSEARRLADSIAKLEKERETLILESEKAENARLELEAALRAAAAKVEQQQAEINRIRVDTASERQRREGIGQQIRTLEANRTSNLARARQLKVEAEELQKDKTGRLAEKERVRIELEVLNNELERVGLVSDELTRTFDERRSVLSQKDKDAVAARRKADEIQSRLTDSDITVRETEIEIRTLCERFSEKLEGELHEIATMGVTEGFDPVAAKPRMAELDEKLRAFGDVNLLADDEYEERKTRFEFLESQRVDLEESLTALKSAIARINRISRERFEQTFEAVNAKFKELYPTLFRGGDAELFLTDPENLLETGIDIIARPPGKRPQHMSLLSGGEKALTAVALIFALFLVKPSPFCVLDEVDAPLDDVNVERLAELISEMSGASQFLVITHNKITMEAAAHLYGVTMEEPGISNLVSVRLKEPFTAVEEVA